MRSRLCVSHLHLPPVEGPSYTDKPTSKSTTTTGNKTKHPGETRPLGGPLTSRTRLPQSGLSVESAASLRDPLPRIASGERREPCPASRRVDRDPISQLVRRHRCHAVRYSSTWADDVGYKGPCLPGPCPPEQPANGTILACVELEGSIRTEETNQ